MDTSPNKQRKRAVRLDAWTADLDEMLARIVLEHIEGGLTQLKAFEEGAKKLNRSAAACGFRWNGVLRRQYADEVERAKARRRAYKDHTPMHLPKEASVPPTRSFAVVVDALTFLQKEFDKEHEKNSQLSTENDRLRAELERAKRPTIDAPENARDMLRVIAEITQRAKQHGFIEG